jgi:hypothetical protein
MVQEPGNLTFQQKLCHFMLLRLAPLFILTCSRFVSSVTFVFHQKRMEEIFYVEVPNLLNRN